MGDTPEMIRQQMQQTKSQLAEKVESLEVQAAEFVQSTRSAVNDTVTAVHDTVVNVTGAVQHAVQMVSHALDVRRQIDRHPWFVLGGSVALGYLAAGFLSASARKSQQPVDKARVPNSSTNHQDDENSASAAKPAATASAIEAAYESGQNDSSGRQLRDVAIGAFIGVVQDLASRAARSMVDYLASSRAKAPISPSNHNEEQKKSSTTQESSEAIRRRLDATSKNVHSGNSF